MDMDEIAGFGDQSREMRESQMLSGMKSLTFDYPQSADAIGRGQWHLNLGID